MCVNSDEHVNTQSKRQRCNNECRRYNIWSEEVESPGGVMCSNEVAKDKIPFGQVTRRHYQETQAARFAALKTVKNPCYKLSESLLNLVIPCLTGTLFIENRQHVLPPTGATATPDVAALELNIAIPGRTWSRFFFSRPVYFLSSLSGSWPRRDHQHDERHLLP